VYDGNNYEVNMKGKGELQIQSGNGKNAKLRKLMHEK
jgi:hypothetical protein